MRHSFLQSLFTEGEEFEVFDKSGDFETITGNDNRQYYKVVTVTKTSNESCFIDGIEKSWETIEDEFMNELYQLHE